MKRVVAAAALVGALAALVGCGSPVTFQTADGGHGSVSCPGLPGAEPTVATSGSCSWSFTPPSTTTPVPTSTPPTPYSPYAATTGLFVDDAAGAVADAPYWWPSTFPTDSRAAAIKADIASVPRAQWLQGGNTQADAAKIVAAASTEGGKLPVLVMYDLPSLDCVSGQGAASAAAYATWATGIAKGIGGSPAIVIVEPDWAIQSCDPNRVAEVQSAMTALDTYAPHTWAYVDAGDGYFNTPATVAAKVKQVHGERGYAVNVSNYNTTATIATFVAGMKAAGVSLPFVWDTSRNGNGPDANHDYCNPAGRKIGVFPQEGTGGGIAGADANLWIQTPGISDGACGTNPTDLWNGFSPTLATNLINGN